MTKATAFPLDVLTPWMPAIPGLRLRGPGEPGDYEAMAAVFAAAALADGLDEVVTPAELAFFVENPVDNDPSLDLRLADVDGRVVGYVWINHRVEGGGDRAEHPGGDREASPKRSGGDREASPKRSGGDRGASPKRSGGDEIHPHRGYVHPEWRRRGIGTALLRHAVGRAVARHLTTDPTAARLLQTFTLESEIGAHALAERAGYEAVRYAFKMRRDLAAPIPASPLPDGIEVRPALPQHRRAIWEAEREAFQDHWGYAPWPEQAYSRFIAFPHYDLGLWQVAWDGDQIVGSVLNYINQDENRQYRRRRGYTEDISVRRPWRRRGIASALIARSLEALRDRGMTEAALGVDAENRTGALRVYQRLGFVVSKQWTVYRRPVPSFGDGTLPTLAEGA